ncbi:MAG: ribonuclease H family protein [Acidimicrobiales bacterium]
MQERQGPTTVVFTDGACLGNPGPGGWAWAVEGPQVPGAPSRAGSPSEARAWPEGPAEPYGEAPGEAGARPFASGAEVHTTNQRMEISAAAAAIAALRGRLCVVSDSTYVVNCFRQRWWEGWQRRGWRNSKGDPVANQDLWRPMVEEALRREVRFRWVKGHGGDPMNELVDRLAREAAVSQAGRSGWLQDGVAP